MAADLFGDIASRPRSARSRRPAVVVVSIATHVSVFLGVIGFSLAAPGLLPAPHTALAFFDPGRLVRLVDLELPAPPRYAAHHADAIELSAAPVHANLDTAAPVVASTGIATETGRESATSSARPSDLSKLEGGGDLNPGGVGRRAEPIGAFFSQAPIRLHSGIQTPTKLVNVDPVYPALAQSARVQGLVILEAVIDVSGRVDSVQVLRSIAMLDQAAVAAVRQWRYTPAILNGSPVPVIVTITVNFKL